MRPYFITASGTDIGKTLVTASLCWQLRQQRKTVTALKPVISGYSAMDMNNDSGVILRSCGLTPTPHIIESISPWRYHAPLSPDMAAAIEGNPVPPKALEQFCREHAQLESDVLLVEGVGGVMAPINGTYTVIDWMSALGWPVILVTGSYLGAISHTLTALEAIDRRGLKLQALIVSESPGSAVALEDTAASLEKFLRKTIPVVKIPRIATKEATWQHAPSIHWLCDE